MSRRTERVNELLREEISDLLLREVKDPRVSGLVTVTEVDVSPDLRVAKVYISILGSEEDRDGTMAALGVASHFLHREIKRRLTIKRVPELRFFRDDSMERGARLLALLDKTEAERS
jgi:ribosome-binding factor A